MSYLKKVKLLKWERLQNFQLMVTEQAPIQTNHVHCISSHKTVGHDHLNQAPAVDLCLTFWLSNLVFKEQIQILLSCLKMSRREQQISRDLMVFDCLTGWFIIWNSHEPYWYEMRWDQTVVTDKIFLFDRQNRSKDKNQQMCFPWSFKTRRVKFDKIGKYFYNSKVKTLHAQSHDGNLMKKFNGKNSNLT